MMNFVHFLALVLCLTNVAHGQMWPQAENLVGFWPLSSVYRVRDVSGNQLQTSALPSSHFQSGLAGPFGDVDTSYSSSPPNAYDGVLKVVETKSAAKLSLKGLSSFTVSFFFRNPLSESGGLLQWLDSNGASLGSPLAIYIHGNHICLGGHGSDGCIYIRDVITPGVWNYLALTFTAVGNGDVPSCSVSLHGRFGQITKPRAYPFICDAMTYSVGGIRLGGTAFELHTWNSDFSVACLMFYNTAITEESISRNYESCRMVLSAATCGAPRLPITPIPQTPAVPARPGQFPWMASLRYKSNNKLICSATIISPFWLLTSASCFSVSFEPSNYFVAVGDFDSTVVETYEKNHIIKGITYKHDSYKEFLDIALIELATPIDFGNTYVNEACIPTGDDTSLIQDSTTSYVIGWGVNGRNPLVLQTTLRYAPSSIVMNSTCSSSWTDKPKQEPLFCFVGLPDASVPCTGDAGSPLLIPVDSSRLVQIGVYSQRNADCTSTTSKLPLFTRTAKFWPWIKSQIACANPGIQYPLECPMP